MEIEIQPDPTPISKISFLFSLLDTELLLSEALNCTREKIILNPKMRISNDNFKVFSRNIHRRKKGEPIAYIIQKKEFWKNTFFVNKNVLIPRPETELLVEQILKKTSKEKRKDILEIGVGQAVSQFPF